MKIPAALALFLVLGIAGGIATSMPHASASGTSQPKPSTAPALINTCLITSDVDRLSAFYAQVLQLEPHRAGKDYVEFHTGTGSTRIVWPMHKRNTSLAPQLRARTTARSWSLEWATSMRNMYA